MAGSADNAAEWARIFASLAFGLLVCVVAIGISYVVLRAWPRGHYPRVFAILAGASTVAALYVLQVPGSGFGLGVLAVSGVFFLIGLADDRRGEMQKALFKNDDDPKGPSGRARSCINCQCDGLVTASWRNCLGVLIGIVLTASVVAAVIMPPAYVLKWASAPEPLGQRIERALNPGDQWVALQSKERDASERLRRSQAELASANKRLAEAETALAKARDELGASTSNTVRGIRISSGNGSRHANGAIYVGLLFTNGSSGSCFIQASSDKVDSIRGDLKAGQAISILSSQGKYRLVVTSLGERDCTFDLVKD
jgi:hypothetical protein